ncbi:MAG: hypothetical protein U1E84_08635 [Rhodoferax sp.]
MPIPASHLCTTLALIPFANATAAMEAPGWRQAAMTLALNSGEWVRRGGVLGCISVRQIRWTPSSGQNPEASRWDDWTLTIVLCRRHILTIAQKTGKSDIFDNICSENEQIYGTAAICLGQHNGLVWLFSTKNMPFFRC